MIFHLFIINLETEKQGTNHHHWRNKASVSQESDTGHRSKMQKRKGKGGDGVLRSSFISVTPVKSRP